jgi:hypothetical protein
VGSGLRSRVRGIAASHGVGFAFKVGSAGSDARQGLHAHGVLDPFVGNKPGCHATAGAAGQRRRERMNCGLWKVCGMAVVGAGTGYRPPMGIAADGDRQFARER